MTEINSRNVFLADIKITSRKRPADPEKVQALAASIMEVGQLQPIVISQSNELIAGFHRYEAMRQLGKKAIAVHRLDVTQKQLVELAQIDENLCRNELNKYQLSKWIQRREELLEQLGKRAKSGGGGKRTKPDGERDETVSPLASTVAERAAEVGFEKRSYQQHLQIANNIDPEVGDDLAETIGDSTTQLIQLSKMPLEQQQQVRDMIKKGGARDVRDASRQLRRITLGNTPLPEGVFNLLTSDIPWKYDDDGARGAAENHYPTLTLEELLAMDFGQLHANNAVHFLWLTKHHHAEAMALYQAWGLEYKTEIVWEKPNIGTGTWSRGKHEKIWVLSRGSDMTPSYVPDSVQHWPAPPEHSRKPAEFFEMVNKMYPHLRKRLELYGRSPREGYVVYGNETEKFQEQSASPIEQEMAHV